MAISNLHNYKVVERNKDFFFKCQYCKSSLICVSSKEIYWTPIYWKLWKCTNCSDVYVWTHRWTEIPLWTVADKELRKWRNLAHLHFDQKWKNKSHTSRQKQYEKLSVKMNMHKDFCHIAMFNIDQCKKCIEICKI